MDVNMLAFRVVKRATDEVEPAADREKREASRKGGLRGGTARARTLSPERRREIAKKASKTRWGKNSTTA
jgi:hypothetical protein